MLRTILSLTSHQLRFSTLDICLHSLFLQTEEPDKVILYLDRDAKYQQLTKETLDLQNRGLEIVITDNYIGPHTKYHYAMRQFPDDIVITVDDDVLYKNTLIADLKMSYKNFPNAVSAIRTHKMILRPDGNLDKYANWNLEHTQILNPSLHLFATGVGGVLYPPRCMNDEVFNVKVLKKFCLYADDIWLKTMQLLSGTPTVYAGTFHYALETISNTQDCALYKYNLHGGGNDDCIAKLVNYYGINIKKILSEEEGL
ncbi:MAG: glycosyltransferase [Candidatus Cloacimonetes bacterium]|nr:glycosyltransferase [Candidatus Cloacimonadota bacterium]